MLKSYLVMVILLLFIPDLSDAGWQFISPMPHGRYGHDASLGPDGKIYVMGGMVFEIKNKRMTYKKYNDGRYSNLVYDPQSDKWQYLDPVPGWGTPNRWMTYDQEKKEWKYHGYKHGMIIPDLATVRRTDLQRQGNGVSIITGTDGKIYWIGGMGKFEWVGVGENIVFPYDQANGAWDVEITFEKAPPEISGGYMIIYNKDIPDMLERRIDHRALMTADGKIYVFGGYRTMIKVGPSGNVKKLGAEVIDKTECYDPEINQWGYKKPLSSKRMLFAAVVGPDDRIYVFGGAAGHGGVESTLILDSTEVYDPKTDSWSTKKPMPAPRQSHDAVLASDGKIYIMGGIESVDSPPLDDVFIYDPINDSWKQGPSMKFPRAAPAAVATPKGKIYVIGGTDVGAYDVKEAINRFLPSKKELYAGKVQDTVEVLDIFKLGK
jgi:N-acetylneuraminic acid mutarotase